MMMRSNGFNSTLSGIVVGLPKRSGLGAAIFEIALRAGGSPTDP